MLSYYTPRRYAARKAAVKRPTLPTVLGAEVMWALAVYADRVNDGRYVKDTRYDAQGTVMERRNRDLIKEEVQAGLPNVTEADFELGRAARTWHRGRLMFKILRGQALSEFEQSLNLALEAEEFSNTSDALSVAIVASQIVAYRKGLAYEAMMAEVDHSPLAPVGTKVTVEATVIRSVFSTNYNVTFITARTQCNRLVFFSYREGQNEGTVIRVRGTVKAHRPDSTQLTRVKLQ